MRPVLDWDNLKGSRLLFCFGDFGGQNLLFSLIRHRDLQGVAIQSQTSLGLTYSSRINIVLTKFENINLKNFDYILSTTGNGTFEKFVYKKALESDIPTFHFLDHYTAYRERFTTSNKILEPKNLVTFDRFSWNLAHKNFHSTRIYFEPNYYLQDMVCNVRSSQEMSQYEVLILDEPIGFMKKEESLSELFEELHQLGVKSILFRAHPSRDDNFIRNIAVMSVDISESTDVSFDIARSSRIVGLSSLSLYIAYLAEKKVYSLDEDKTTQNLPIKSISNYRNILAD